MSYRLKIGLVVLGLAILLASLGALVYAYWPAGVLRETAPIAPTLLAAP